MSRGKAQKPVAKPIKSINIFEVLNDLPEEVPVEQPPVAKPSAAPLTWADLQTKYGSPSDSWADDDDE